MLQYFYRLIYDFSLSAPAESHHPGHNLQDNSSVADSVLVLHARVYALGEKYMVEGLKALAIENFSNSARNLWNTDGFFEAAREVYTSTIDSDRGLRDIVVKVFHDHQERLIHKDDAAYLLTEVPLLGIHILRYPNHWPSQSFTFNST